MSRLSKPLMILSLAVFLILAAPSKRAGDVETGETAAQRGSGTSPVVYHVELSESGLETEIANELGNGKQLVDIEVLTTPGPVTYFSGVFYPVSGTVHRLIHGDETEWEGYLDMVQPLEGRWLDLEVGYHLGSTRRWSALFLEDGDDYAYLVDSHMTDDELQTTKTTVGQNEVTVPGIMEQQLRDGRSMVDFEAYTDPILGQTVFAGIWSEDPNQPKTHLYYDLELADLSELWTPLAGRIVDFERYHSDFFGEERFALLVANVPGGEYYVDTWMDYNALNTTNAAESDQDTHLIDLHVFPDPNGPGVLYSGVWGETWKALAELPRLPTVDTIPLTPQLNALIDNFEVNGSNGEGLIGFYAKNLRTQQAVSYRANSPFYLASATKTAAHIRYWMQVEAGHFPSGGNTLLQFSTSANSGAPWYVDERCPGADLINPLGFGTGQPGPCSMTFNNGTTTNGLNGANLNDLGQSFPLDRYDRAMMRVSDNAATSALIDDTTYGLAYDTTNLNEWLSSVPGVGQGWGLVTSIHDVDRLIFWNGQHTNGKKSDPSVFTAPGHTFGGYRNDYLACTVGGNPPADCVNTSCQRCFTGNCTNPPMGNPNGCQVVCSGGETCQPVVDPWGDMLGFLGTSSLVFPDWTIGFGRYFAMGPNSASPRAYSNLLEKFWDLEFHSGPTRDQALLNMSFGSPLDDDFPCREDITGSDPCNPDEGFITLAAKGGSKGSENSSTAACVSTAMVQLDNNTIFNDADEMVTVIMMTRDNGDSCSDIGTNWGGPFGLAMVQAVTVDLQPGPGSFGPTTAIEQGQMQIDLHVMNIGGADSDTFDVRIHASADTTYDPGADPFVADITVPAVAGNSTYVSGLVNVALPSNLGPGTYYLLARIDWQDGVDEFDERGSSNIGVISGDQLTVLPPCPDDDADGYADCDPGCLPPGSLLCDDCNDMVDTIYPGAIEQCNGVDDDCDMVIDNDIPTPTVGKRIEHEDPNQNDLFGNDIANLGDVNGDGFDDLAIGMPYEDSAAGLDTGIVRVVSGADQTTICDAQLPTQTQSDYLGWSVAAAGGDLNGNGTDDLVVGVLGYDNPPYNFSGAAAAFNLPDCAFIRLMVDPAMDSSDRLGESITSIGDLNADAVPEIAVSSLYNDLAGTSARGAITVFSGADGSVLFNLFDPAGEADELGTSLAGPGDLTGDGIPDIVSGAPETDTLDGSYRGAVYVFSGATGSLHTQITDPDPDAFADFGESVASLGDLNADGISELAVGASGDVVGSFRPGSVSIFDGATGFLVRRLFDPAATAGSGFGTDVAPIEDVSGDGLPDVIVGANLDDDLGTDTGSVWVFDSATGGILHTLFSPAPRADDGLGTRVLSLGDLSGDGFSEIAAGAPFADDLDANQSGHVLILSFEEDCDADGISPYGGDCDDANTAVSPDAVEVCDGVDNNCNGVNNEDFDGDGFSVCADCNDQDARVNPDAVEICNGVDDDCAGGIDFTPGMVDGDGDGVDPPCDCDDTNPAIEPGNPEICDHIDNDCSGIPDDGSAMLVSERVSALADGVFGDRLAASLTSLGDVNFDGVDDYAAGVPQSDQAATNAGAAVIFDGATGLPHCTATPTAGTFAAAGTSVAGIGDINADGAGDLAVGTPFNDTTANNAGSVFVVSGADCSTIRELNDSNGATRDELGRSVTAIGDLNGDGIREIAAGAPRVDTAQDQSAGAVLVWDGATGSELFKLMDDRSGGSHVGESVAGIDDVNADGIPDILAGAPFDDGLLGSDVGSVLVFSGADGSVIHKLLDPAGTGGDDLGTSVAGIGDLNGDAIPDVLAGAPDEDSGGGNNGAVLVFSGIDGVLIQRVPLTDTFTNLSFGTSVSALPDLNGDGVPEFAGGAPDDDDANTNAGRVLVIDGATLTPLHDITVADSSEGGNLGASLAAIGDLSGDGYPEILIGQPGQDILEDKDAGRVIVIGFESDCDADGVGLFEDDCDDQDGLRAPGMLEVCDGVDNDCDVAIDEDEDGDGADACADCAPAIPTIQPGMFELCNAIDDNCNSQVDEGVDLDADGYTTPCDCNDDDFDINAGIIEVCNAVDDNCDGQVDEGFGSPLDQVRIEDPEAAAGYGLGTSMAAVGDVDNDDFMDIVAGVPGDDTGALSGGAAILISGASRTVICRMVDPAAASSKQMGNAVAGIGDVTGDGIGDVAVGARLDDPAGTNSGSVQVFSGADCSWVRELLDPTGAAQDQFGSSVAGIGDVNGDGVGDIGVGVPRDDENGLTDTGSVVVFDGASGAWLYTAVDLHARQSDWMGTSVSALGDVDFDGIPDFVAGATLDQVGGLANAGAVSVFSGVDGHWIRSFTHPSVATSDEMARSIAAAGDMNGDGVPDLLAGVENDDGPANSGSVLAFSGADGSVIRTFQDSAPLNNANLGYSVTAAGDLNGDGVTEVVAGAYDSTRSGTGAGEVVVFDGTSGTVLHRFVDLNPASDDDLGATVLVAGDLTGGGGVEILAGAPKADPYGLSSAGYIAVFSIEPDCDGDGLSPLFDCDDADVATQGGPGSIQSLVFDSKSGMSWLPPSNPGGSPATLSYDVVRSNDPADFTTATLCVESDDDTDTVATDTDDPASGSVHAYLVRVQNRCGDSVRDNTAGPRNVAQCP